MKTNLIDACALLFKQVDKPKNFETCKAINVYDNKYRINVYTRSRCPIYDVDKIRITQSFFCKITDDKLTIVA